MRLTNEDARSILLSHDFDMLTDFIGQNRPITIQCKKCSTIREFKRSYNCVIVKPTCKKCGEYSWQKYNLDSVRQICAENKVEFLDNFYRGANHTHRFQCEHNHVWLTTFADISKRFRKGKKGCLQCSRNNRKNKLEDIISKLDSLDIEFKDENYINNAHPHTMKCKKCGHIWKAATGLTSNNFRGCPKCNTRLNEKLLGEYLKALLPSSDIQQSYRIYHKIIFNKKIIRNSIIVDYKVISGDKTIFIEYNGRHHFEPTRYTDNRKIKEPGLTEEIKLEEQKTRDRWLRRYCKRNNIYLIEIDGRKYTKEQIKKYLEDQLNLIF